MGLTERKYINNTKQLPGFAGGWEKFKTRWNEGGGDKAMSALATGINAAQQFNSMKYPTNYAGDFVGKYGVNNYGSIDGINYQQYNDIDTNAEERRMGQQRDSKILSGATLGATTGLGIGSTIAALSGIGAGTAAGAGAAAVGAAAGAGTAAATGAGLLSWLGPAGIIGGLGIGALIGGILGNKSKHEEEEQMRIAQTRQNNANEAWRTDALSTALRNRELEEYGDTTRYNLLSGVALGAEDINTKTGYTKKKHVVHTSDGVKVGNADAMVDNNEIIENAKGTKAHRVVGNPNKTDGEYADLKKGDKVASDKLLVPGTNMTFAEYYPIAKALGQDKQFWNAQRMVRNNTNQNMHAIGWLPGVWNGWEGLGAVLPGMIQSWRDYNDAANDDIHRTNITPIHKYEGAVRDIMGGLRLSPYQQLRSISNSEGAQRYNINQSGGLSSMQRTMANIGNSMNSRIARANALANVDQLNAQFKRENAQLLNQTGTSLMDANMRAQMFNEQQNAAAHAARTDQLNKSKYNMINYLQQGFKNIFERNQFDKMYDLYAQQVATDRIRALKEAGLVDDSNKNKLPKEMVIPTQHKSLKYKPITVPFAAESEYVPFAFGFPQNDWRIKWR